MTAGVEKPVERYFSAVNAALSGLDVYLGASSADLERHDIVLAVAAEHLSRLRHSFSCWQNRLRFSKRFKISRAESGFPVFQHVLELANDRRGSAKRLSTLPDADTLRREMADFILRHKQFPFELQESIAERLYLEEVAQSELFDPFILPKTSRISINPNNRLPYYVVHWASYDGSAHLPLIYMATIEDSTNNIVRNLVGRDGRVDKRQAPSLPVEGLLNPDLAHRFDDFAERNCAYSLSPATIAGNLDKDFDTLHPKQLRRMVLGPFYSPGITEHNSTVSHILGKIRKVENAWLLTWTVQEVFSKAQRPGRRGLWSSEPPRETFHLETNDLEAARQGVSAYQKHALVPHEAYQALYASGQAHEIFDGYRVHVISSNHVISDI